MPGTATMGRPKKGEAKPGPQKATAAAADERAVIVHLKGTPAYAAKLDEISRKTHIAKATIIRLALAEWAENHGHGTFPEM
jgi:hypothetical protein